VIRFGMGMVVSCSSRHAEGSRNWGERIGGMTEGVRTRSVGV
jgi:hypothetical protein